MNFIDIVKKHNYNEEFSGFLNRLYKELVDVFKDEELIYNALMSAEIISVSSIYDYLDEVNKLEGSNEGLVSNDDLKNANGLRVSDEEIVYDEDSGTYKLKSVWRKILIKDFDLSKDEVKARLIHEVCHLIKSYYNEYTINGDELVVRSGLIEKYYKLTYDNGKVKKSLIKEVGVGLEEGLTSVLEESIMRKMVNSDYEVTNYKVVNIIASGFLNLSPDVVIKAELYHDNSELYQTYGYDDYNEFLKYMDLLFKLNMLKLTHVGKGEELNEIASEMNELLNNPEFTRVWESMKKKVNNAFSI